METKFEEYLRMLETNGVSLVEEVCPDCLGDCEVECPCCGEGMVECDECGGIGKTLYPDFDDFRHIYRIEMVRLEMWNRGEALHKTEHDWTTMPTFILDGTAKRDVTREFRRGSIVAIHLK